MFAFDCASIEVSIKYAAHFAVAVALTVLPVVAVAACVVLVVVVVAAKIQL